MSKALSQAAKLKPEIRLAQALSEFCASLVEPRARAYRTLQTTSPPTPSDVIRLTEEINRDGARNHRAWLPYATRMALFLDKVQTMSRIGDFLLGSAQNMIASGIWAAIKITLGVAVGSLAFFRRISELSLKVGRSSSITKDIVQVYPDSKDLQDLMCEYFITLVTFCQKIVTVLDKPTVIQLASPFIGFFDKEAAKFEADLNQWATAIDRTATVLLSNRHLNTANSVAWITQTLSKWAPIDDRRRKVKEQQDLALRHERLQERFCSRQSEHVATWRRQRKKGTAEWLFKEQAYRDWKGSTKSSTMRIQGKLGSGKTVLLANIVAELFATPRVPIIGASTSDNNQTPAVAYHFCNHDRVDSDTSESIIGSVLRQILASLDSNSHLLRQMDEYFQHSWHDILDREVFHILGRSFPGEKQIFILVDGLDACTEETVAEVLGIIKLLSETCQVHFCCSTRIDTRASNLIRTTFLHVDHEVAMSSAAFHAEMQAYIGAEFDRRRHIRDMDHSLEAILKEVLVKASEGMYLWVALQIEALFPLHGTALLSSADILQLLENLPKDLPEAFDRALESIKDPRYGVVIFQLVAAARRPLTMDELRIALHVKPGDTNCNSTSVPKDGKAIIALCGGNLLEIDDEDDTVHFIHHSVYRHLTRNAAFRPRSATIGATQYYFRESDADILMGCLCVTYLNYNIFDAALTSNSKSTLDTDLLTKHVTNLALAQTSVATKIIASFMPRPVFRRQAVDFGNLLQRYLESEADTVDSRIFLGYAYDYWLEHTTLFWPSRCGDAYDLFLRLVGSTPNHVSVPWKQDSLVWATDNDHFGMILGSLYLSTSDVDKGAADTIIYAIQQNPDRASEVLDLADESMAKELLHLAMDDLVKSLDPTTGATGLKAFEEVKTTEGASSTAVYRRLDNIMKVMDRPIFPPAIPQGRFPSRGKLHQSRRLRLSPGKKTNRQKVSKHDPTGTTQEKLWLRQ